MTPPLNVADWYWFIGSDETRAFSTVAGGFVQAGNARFTAWRAAGFQPTRIASQQELIDLLDASGVALPAGASISDVRKQAKLGVVDAVLLRIAFDHENRVRALESKPPATAQQFLDAVKGLL